MLVLLQQTQREEGVLSDPLRAKVQGGVFFLFAEHGWFGGVTNAARSVSFLTLVMTSFCDILIGRTSFIEKNASKFEKFWLTFVCLAISLECDQEGDEA